ncbi:MAG: aldolase [Desulfuromonas sp.]|nr:MAG: aldolase [Desulfuromonas sp.]
MTPTEGVIKFELAFSPGPPPPRHWLTELDAWREIFRRLGLLGQDPARYDGFGFGNLSRRSPDRSDHAFLISATQTGNLKRLQASDYVRVVACDSEQNRVVAEGVNKPSSEALSHAVLYQAHGAIDWVMHLHSPDIFACRHRLQLPCTAESAAYGTVAMAREIDRLARDPAANLPLLIVMGGHQDGILACGSNVHEVGKLVVANLAEALRLQGSL